MEVVDKEPSSAGASLLSAEHTAELESGTKSRTTGDTPDTTRAAIPAARIEALIRRLAQQPEQVVRPAPLSTFLPSSAPLLAQESSHEAPVSPMEGILTGADHPTSDADEDSKRAKKAKRFTKSEDDIIIEAVRLHGENGENWQRISDALVDRTPTQIRSRFKRIQKPRTKGDGTTTWSGAAGNDDDRDDDPLNTSTSGVLTDNEGNQDRPALGGWGKPLFGPNGGVTSANLNPNPSASPSGRHKRSAPTDSEGPTAKRPKQREDGAELLSGAPRTPTHSNFLETGNYHSSRSNSPTHKPRFDSENSSEMPILHSSSGGSGFAKFGIRDASNLGAKSITPEEIQLQIDTAVQAALEEQLRVWMKRDEEWSTATEQLEAQIERLNKVITIRDNNDANRDQAHTQMLEHVSQELKTVLRESETRSRAAIREKLAQDCTRLGYSAYGRNGEEFREGIAAKVLKEKEQKLEDDRAAYEATKKRLTKRKTTLSAQTTVSSTLGTTLTGADQPISPSGTMNGGGLTDAAAAASSSSLWRGPSPSSSSGAFLTPDKELEDIIMNEHLIKLKLAALKVDEQELVREREVIRMETQLHYKELRRFAEEEASKFNGFPILNERYLMLQLLGRGGFSEVYRAYDLKAFRYVACKIHQLSMNWTTEKKASYMRHAERECEIHKALVHPRIVALYETFEIDSSTFCTVMEYCKGGDLDSHLKQNKSLPEAEARVLIAQLFDGLRYMMTREKDKQKIIHYDLKPGNILFDENGSIKIADFGLSKIMDSDSDSMELTSQGAGTYWYLPPECFSIDKPKITSKVDVWSAGVILYQMLFGSKPFGHNISQKHILERHIINPNVKVDFPSSKKVSEEAKAFLQRCLTADVSRRPDALELASDPFLTFVTPSLKRGGSSSLSSVASSPSSTPPAVAPSSPSSIGKMGPPLRVASLASNSGPTTATIGGGTLTFVRK